LTEIIMNFSKSLWISAALALSASAFGAGCAATTEDGQADSTESELVVGARVVGTEVQGKTVEVAAGVKLVVSLPNSNGYYWQVKESGGLGTAERGTIAAQGDFNHTPPSSATFTWETRGKVGTYQVSLIQQLPLPELTAPKSVLSFTVKVSKTVGGQGLGKACGGFAGPALGCADGLTCVANAGAGADRSGVCKKVPTESDCAKTGFLPQSVISCPDGTYAGYQWTIKNGACAVESPRCKN
jgi:hypothetical protein